ncbi:ParB/RepB/Spo0J family partition protein [Streptomyces sp. NPDC048057]|uniref:ParB/RepB/Spo0J family partition protein n=1 Tax=Streptomyces sp. NPDC048057 TaxID=3155628 RepID=UPI00340D35D6
MTAPISALDLSHPLRSGWDPQHVKALAVLDASLLPPILVHRPTMRVLDGQHRVRAEQLRGGTHIRAEFFEGTEDESFVLAVRANVAHGLPLSLGDRKAAASRILRAHPRWSDRSIGSVAGLSPKTVGAIRRRSAEEDPRLNGVHRVGRDGRTHPASATAGRLHASRLISERPHASLREIANSAGISLGTAQDVRKRLANGQHPVPSPRNGVRRVAAASPHPLVVSEHVGDGSDDDGAGTSARSGAPEQRRPSLPEQLRVLRQDPSLRSTDMGRALLRMLSFHEVPLAHWQAFVDGVPPHRASAVADLADACAGMWQEFARELAGRAAHG